MKTAVKPAVRSATPGAPPRPAAQPPTQSPAAQPSAMAPAPEHLQRNLVSAITGTEKLADGEQRDPWREVWREVAQAERARLIQEERMDADAALRPAAAYATRAVRLVRDCIRRRDVLLVEKVPRCLDCQKALPERVFPDPVIVEKAERMAAENKRRQEEYLRQQQERDTAGLAPTPAAPGRPAPPRPPADLFASGDEDETAEDGY